MHESNENIQRTIELSRQLIQVANTSDLEREDDTCSVVFGIVRENAYTILDEAKRERLRHVDRGWRERLPAQKNRKQLL